MEEGTKGQGMSVFIRADSKDGIYSYDFRIRGRRFSGSTEATTKREAREVEKAKKEEAKAIMASQAALFAADMTISTACARYWEEVGQHHKNSDTTERVLDWIVRFFGFDLPLMSIGPSEVAAMVAKRRGEFIPSQRKPGRKYKTPEVRRRVSAATVNRTATQPLREILLRAGKVWKVRVQDIDWSEHLLPELQERVREATPAEEDAIMGEVERGYDVALDFAFQTGCRRMEIVGLVWTQVDFFNRQFTVVGKGNKSRVIPMTEAVFHLLWEQQGHHPDRVFTYVAKRTVKLKDGSRLCRGQRYPLTEAGFKTASRRAIARSGVKNFRPHDARHTAATRVLRKSNLRVVQNLLGHSDVKTTTKYAHAMIDDIRSALEAASSTETTTPPQAGDRKRLKR